MLQALMKEDPMIHYVECGAAFACANSSFVPEELRPNIARCTSVM